VTFFIFSSHWLMTSGSRTVSIRDLKASKGIRLTFAA